MRWSTLFSCRSARSKDSLIVLHNPNHRLYKYLCFGEIVLQFLDGDGPQPVVRRADDEGVLPGELHRALPVGDEDVAHLPDERRVALADAVARDAALPEEVELH